MKHTKHITRLLAGTALLVAPLAGAATVYNGNLNTGFGGAIGNGSLSLSDDGTTITATLTRGGGNFDDAFVIYIDSTTGGVGSTSGLTDTADGLRRSISGYNGTDRSTVNLSYTTSDFAADYAIALSVNSFKMGEFGGLWSLSNAANLPLVGSVNLTPSNNTSAASYTFTFNLADIGMSAGQSLRFVTTYLNGNDAYRAGEAIGNDWTATTFDGFGNIGFNTANATAAMSYTTVPEAGSALLGGLGTLVLMRRRRC